MGLIFTFVIRVLQKKLQVRTYYYILCASYDKVDRFANNYVESIIAKLPVKCKTSKKLVSTDRNSNTARHEYTILLQMVPLCQDDLAVAPREFSGDLMIISQLSTNVHLINPLTSTKIELSAIKWFSSPFYTILSAEMLEPFIILSTTTEKGWQESATSQVLMTEVVVAKEKDMGINNDIFSISS